MNHSIIETLTALLEPFRALGDPGKRVFLPFLLGALLLAALAALREEGQVRPGLTRDLLSRRLWLHPSALLDVKLLFAKALLRAALLAPLLVSTLAVTAAVAVALRQHLGAAPAALADFGPVTVGAVYTLVAFLADDATRFLLHRSMHRVPWLWELHKVHHSAQVLTPITLYRTHPIESALSALRGALVIGAVTGVFAWLFGDRVRGWEVLGVDALGFAWSLLGANLRHSHVWLSYGPRLEHLLISPAQHQVHHSDRPEHGERNYGTALALWDWLGGSLYVTRRREALRFGLPPGEPSHGPTLASLLLRPIASAGRALWAPPRLREVRAARLPAGAAAALGLAVALCGSCQTGGGVDRGALLRELGQCALSAYRDFAAAAAELRAAAEAAAADPAEGKRAAAQAAWARAVDLWQQAEPLDFGPAAASPSPGAQGLRGGIYAFPDFNRCLLEQQLVARIYEGDVFSAVPESTRGLAALEYLLFYAGADNACAATAAINQDGTWAALGADELARRKAAYARAAAADLHLRAQALVRAWEPGQGGFLTQLQGAGAGSAVFSSQAAALKAAADGLFHLEFVVKDRKLAMPLGLRDCAAASCPEALESPFADRGRLHVRNNLLGFRKVMQGCGPDGAGLGFDDLISGAGNAELAGRMTRDLQAAIAAAEGLSPPSLRQALIQSRPAVEALYQAVKRVADQLKGELTVTLQVSPPRRVEGDQD